MDSENGVPVEDEKKVIIEKSNGEEGSSLELDVINKNEVVPKDEEKTDKEGPNPSGPAPSLSKSKTSTAPKTNKLTKNQSNSRTSVVFGRSTKPSLTQSLSFPGRGRNSDVMKRSIEVYPSKSDIKQSQKNSSKIVANGSSSPRISSVGKGPFPGVNSKSTTTAGKAAAGRRTTLASMPSLKQSSSGKNVSANGDAANSATDVLVEKDSEPSNSALPVKDEDARSTTSSNLTPRAQQRLNVSAFSFRLEERAEKRKEFFSKIEQKVQAKEQEKNNLQEKSKENQEAEIKQLRKGLTFKATPMPSFYKEPPPKVELKKIPTTRAISPKLGRNKTITSNSLENGGSCVSPRVSRDNNCKSPKTPQANGDKGNTFLKKSVKSSLSKPNTREPTTPKKIKNVEKEDQDKQTNVQEETQSRPRCPPEIVDEIEEELEKNSPICDNGSKIGLPNSDAMPAEVAVEG